jgi:predicted peptidase
MMRWISFIVVIMMSGHAFAQTTRPAQKVERFSARITIEVDLNHLVFLPADYGKDPDKRWPLMIFLHGAGERGNDIEKVKAWGPPKLVEQRPDFPFVLISPQCAEGKWWEPAAVNALLDKALATYHVDSDRVYLTGISMGGFGTWATAMAYPERFAAIVPICGGGDVWRAQRLKDMPIWAFHGDKDKLVPVERSIEMIEAVKKAGGIEAKLTRYPEVGHDSWKQAYDTPGLYEWMLSHSRKPVPATK